MKAVKIITYILSIIFLLYLLTGLFLNLREVIYRSNGMQTEMSKFYNFSDKQSIIINSIECVYKIFATVLLIWFLYKRKFNKALIVCGLILLIFFTLAYLEQPWVK